MVILGTHRSGTSALMGALRLCGVNIGSHWLENLYEHPAIVTLHDEMLSHLNSVWDQTFLLGANWWTEKKVELYRDKIIEIIRTDFKDADWWGIKDPRMCVLIPLWLDIFKELSITPYFVISVRNPYEIAKSHERRDHFSLEKSIFIWMEHLLSAEYYTREYPRVFSKYTHLIANPMEAISHIMMTLKIQLPKSIEESRANLKAFIRPDLKHHSLPETNDNVNLPAIIDDLNRFLLGCCENNQPQNSTIEAFDTIRSEFSKMKRFLLNTDLKKQLAELRTKQQQSHHAALEISKFGRDFMSNGKFKESKKLYENLVQILPQNFVFWNNLGVALENMDEIEEAESCFKKALDIKQDYSFALDNLQRLNAQSSNRAQQPSSR
jgi:tetratricopeptide (TPR) repeat protein